jgi:hypothetical protein
VGSSVCGPGDLDGDGFRDFAVGAAPNGDTPGTAWTVSGRNGTILETFAVGFQDFGRTVAFAGDLDGDGFADLIVGAPNDDVFANDAGAARAISGASGAAIWTVRGAAGSDFLGSALAMVGDVDADGVPDVLIGAPQSNIFNSPYPTYGAGYARLLSGASGAVIHVFVGNTFGDWFGAGLAGVGDIDGDGVPDFVIGAPQSTVIPVAAGYAKIFSGATGAPIATWLGVAVKDGFGRTAAGVGDVNGDGIPDVAIGANEPFKANSSAGPGHVEMRSGSSGAILWSASGGANYVKLGDALAAAGDVNGDGIGDVIAGGPGDQPNGAGSGSARVLSGANGSQLYKFNGLFQEQAGLAVAGGADVDLDGRPDLFVGAPMHANNGYASVGITRAYSGIDGTLLYEILGATQTNEMSGFSVSAGGDVNGDGYADLAIGSPYVQPVVRVYSTLPLGLGAYGTGTPGCFGEESLSGHGAPKVGKANWFIAGDRGPANALSLALVTDVPDLAGSDPFGIAVKLHVDLFASTQVYGLDAVSGASGNAVAPVPIPNNPLLAGSHYYAQVLSAWTSGPCVPSAFALSTSRGLAIEIQAP